MNFKNIRPLHEGIPVAPTLEEMGRFCLPIACSMVRNLPAKISPIHMLKNDTLFNLLFVLIKINLIFEGASY